MQKIKVFVSSMLILLTSACATRPVLNENDTAALQLSDVLLPPGRNDTGGVLETQCPELSAPIYPPLSRAFREEGKVILRVELDESGRVSGANVTSSSGSKRLDDAALAAVKTWRCDPVQRNGRPVRAVALQPFNFVLPSRATANDQSQSEALQKLNEQEEVRTLIKENFVESVNPDRLREPDLKKLMHDIDPQGEYFDKTAFQKLFIAPENAAGIGLNLSVAGDFLKINFALDDTPAVRAGLYADDLIVKIDDVSVKGLTLTEATNRLQGKAGTTVKLMVRRKGRTNPLNFVLQREIIRHQIIKPYQSEPGYVHIRLSHFSDDTTATLAMLVKELYLKEEPKGLVLDLRDNAGGLLHGAAGISAIFLPPDMLVASIEGRAPDSNLKLFTSPQFYLRSGPDYMKTLPADIKTIPLAVLVNERSAAASEIVAGALQDYGRAVIVGTRTAGRASIQTIFPLAGGSGLKLTTAYWYTPKKRTVENGGLLPDVVSLKMVAESTQKRSNNDTQLDSAISILKARQRSSELPRRAPLTDYRL